MIIRSQDKYSTTESLELRIVKRRPPTNGEYRGEDIYTASGIFLGHYSTEEKAIKVLDMIQQEYGRHFYGQGGLMATEDIYIQPFAFVPTKVFQMPSDEEVEL